MCIVHVCICLYQRKGWKRGGNRGGEINKGGIKRKAIPNLTWVVARGSYSAAGCHGVPAHHPNRPENPACPTGPRQREQTQNEQTQREQRELSKAFTPLDAQTEARKSRKRERQTGKKGSTPPILRWKRPACPCTKL